MAFFSKNKDKNDNSIQYEIPPIVDKVITMYRNSYDNKVNIHAKWDECYKAYTSELFETSAPDYKSKEISNFIFGTIETVKPIMVSSNPKILVLPNREQDYPKSDLVQHALDYEWDRTKMFTKLLQSITYGLVYGTVPVYLPWNPNKDGIGQVEPMVISPFNLFPDPMATDIDDAEYIIYACYKNVGSVIKAYPDKAEELKKNTTSVEDEYLIYGKDSNAVATSRNNVLYIECYMRDYEMETTDIQDEDGNTNKQRSMKYPNGRRIVIAGDVLLYDGENPYKDGKFPFVLWKCYDLPGQFWGLSEVEYIISPQKYISQLTNCIIDNAQQTANEVWLVDKNSGVQKGSISNRPGLVIRKNPGTDVKRDAPPPMPAYIKDIIETMKSDMEKISGVYDVTRGERPTGITAAAAIQALNEQAQGRIKLKIQCLEQFLSEFGSMYLNRIQQFWVTKRSIRIMGAMYNPNQQLPEGALPVQGTGKYMKFEDVDGDDVDGDFDIKVVGGSTMATNKSAKLQMLIQLAQTTAEDGLPMVDRQTVLENADISNVQEVMQRFDQIKQQKAQEQQEQLEQQMQTQNMQNGQDIQNQMALQNNQAENQMAVNEHMNMNQQLANQNSQGQQAQEEQPDEITQLIQVLSKMKPAEFEMFVKQHPEILKILQMLQNESNNPQE